MISATSVSQNDSLQQLVHKFEKSEDVFDTSEIRLLWQTLKCPNMHVGRHSYKLSDPKDREDLVFWPTAAHADDDPLRHGDRPIHPEDMEGSVLGPAATHANDHSARRDFIQLDSKGNLFPNCFKSISPHPEYRIPQEMCFRSLAS